MDRLIAGAGFTAPAAFALVERHGAERATESLENAKAVAAAGKLKNSDRGRGLIISYLDKDWEPSAELVRARKRRCDNEAAERKRQRAVLERDLAAYDVELVRGISEADWPEAFEAGCAEIRRRWPAARPETQYAGCRADRGRADLEMVLVAAIAQAMFASLRRTRVDEAARGLMKVHAAG